jgi:predicted nucleic acid-binding protein
VPGREFLLDPNVVTGLLSGQTQAIELLDRYAAKPETSAISQITRMELLSFPGLQPEEETRVHNVLGFMPVLLLDEQVEAMAIQLRRKLRLRLPDAIIAATAHVSQRTLLTLDQRLAAQIDQGT